MEIFDVFSMNGIENNPASGEIFLENVILKVSQTHFSRISIPRGGGHKFFKGGQCPPLGGAVKYPALILKFKISYKNIKILTKSNFQEYRLINFFFATKGFNFKYSLWTFLFSI